MSLLMVRKYAPAHAADAHIDDIAYKYKVGDKIKTPDGVGTVQKKTHTNSGKPAYEVKLDKGGIVVHVEQSVSAAHAADASEVQRVEKLLKRELTDAEFWKLGDYVMKHMKVGKTFTDNELLSAVKDAADADKSEELEREIKGDVVAVVSGNAARVSKDVSFAAAKEGVESFARKNGVSVIASQEYGEAYKFKFSAAVNDAQDANGDEVIAQKNGYKLVHNTLNDGYWFYTKSGAGWGLTATNKVAAVNEFKRLVN